MGERWVLSCGERHRLASRVITKKSSGSTGKCLLQQYRFPACPFDVYILQRTPEKTHQDQAVFGHETRLIPADMSIITVCLGNESSILMGGRRRLAVLRQRKSRET